MRLIDADWVAQKCVDACLRGGATTFEFAHIMNTAPTIPAIPVEWLEEKRKDFDAMSRGGHHSAWIIKALILQWQKEQEAR